MIKSGFSIASQYLTNFNILCIGLLIIAILVYLVIVYIKSPKSKVNYKIVVPSILIYGLAFSQIVNFVLDKGIVTTNFFDIRARYMDYGFSYSFLNSVVNNGVKKPSSYSKSSMDDLEYALGATDSISSHDSVITVKSSEIETNVEPNIIMVQLESFIDPLWIKTIYFSEDPIPNFRKIFDNYTSGLLTIPGLGGGTANSEFEVITGFSSSLFGAGEFPFNTLLSSDTSPSLAYYLKNLGYSSHALHNNDATFYSRYKAYKNLGFDTFTPMECMPNMDRTPMGWAKDTYLTSEIEKLLTNTDTPDLVFAVSVQGHGSYPNSPLEDSVIKVSSDKEISNLNSIEYYVNQLHEMDLFIGELIDMVNSLNEPSIIVFYGDHHPAIDVKAEDFVTNSLYTTPYAIWDNLGLEKESINLKAYELSSYIIKNLNLPETILSNLHNSIIDEDLKEEYLHLIQYDSLYGKDYLNLKETITSNDSFTYGVNIPIINSVEESDDSINIIGENFNVYSKVFVNDTAIDSTFIDNTTLSLGNYKLKSGDIITVRDMTSGGKIELLSSSSFEY
ncbi:LTA synthase family protein [uncultured Clostridium sp.]|uniref:LTA synthase family protein n=1 Tax=uncultured Clostridium sp. TaxID=59620 RepID=UPI0025952F93|nr:LTA synthase family protein [uncultured Clostridium sp.]